MSKKQKMLDDLIDTFIQYQWRLENPMPVAGETKEMMIDWYRNDTIFNAKVRSMATGVMTVVAKHVDLDNPDTKPQS